MEKRDLKQQIDQALGRLRTLRDELRVHAHLGNMELHDALRDLEVDLEQAERAAKHATDAVFRTLRDLEARFEQLGKKLASAEPRGSEEGMSPQRSSAMMGELSNSQIEEVLAREYIGRIGCHAKGRTYVVPVSYAYQGNAVYAHSPLGMKVDMMRENPEVCFEVEQVSTLLDWRSVVAWGRFEELSGEDSVQAMRLLIEHMGHHTPASSSAMPHGETDSEHPARMPVVYRIRLREKTGRYEPCPG